MLEATIPMGLTFDDVLLVPARSDIVPRDTDVSTILTNHIPISAVAPSPGAPGPASTRRAGIQTVVTLRV